MFFNLCSVEVFFKILGSSSSGNAAVLRVHDQTILIDAGLSGKKLQFLLGEEGIAIEDLSAVFLTHEHNDHSAGIRGSQSSADCRFLQTGTPSGDPSQVAKASELENFRDRKPFSFESFEIHPFSVPHDAYDPVGFYFKWGKDDLFDPFSSLAWVTDLGYVPALVRERIRQARILVLEANHCSKMLEDDKKRPWSLKQRIRGRHGHLSNQSTFDLLDSMEGSRWEKIFLMHLSKDCNDVELVKDRFSLLKGQGNRFSTYVVDPNSAESIPL